MGPLLFQYTVSYNFSDICIHVKYMQYLNKGWEALLKTGILSLLLNFIIVCAQRKPCAKHKLTVCMGRVFFLGYFHGQAQLERGIWRRCGSEQSRLASWPKEADPLVFLEISSPVFDIVEE